jgi:hypothetical protein
MLLRQQALRSPTLQEEISQARAERPPSNSARSVSLAETRAGTGKLWIGYAVTACLLLAMGLFAIRARPNRSAPSNSSVSVAKTLPPKDVPAAEIPPVILFLPAGILRGQSPVPTLTHADPKVPVILQIELRSVESKSWSALLTRSAMPVLRVEPVEVQVEGPIHFVSVPVSPATLADGEYRVTLSPVDEATARKDGLPVIRNFRISLLK